MNVKQCPVCGAKWMDGQLYWSTGKPGKDEDLNALVCRNLKSDKSVNCINPQRGAAGGVGWEDRMAGLKDLSLDDEPNNG